MKKLKIGGAVAAVFLALSSWASSLEVTDVKIAQRYPWNGLVDITYTVKSDDANKDVWVYPVGYDADTDTSVALMPQYLSGEGASNAVHQGTHRMTWNMAAQMGKDYNRAAFSVSVRSFCDAAPYMVVDLSAGSEADKYGVSYLDEPPHGGWTDEPYKTTKMVLRLIPPGTTDNVTLTQPYYFAIIPMTEQQYCLIVGGTPDSATDFKRGVSYVNARGSVLGSKWPQHQQVDAESIMGKLRLRTGITFDLPTLAQRVRAQKGDAGENIWGTIFTSNLAEWCRDWGGDTENYWKAGDVVSVYTGEYYPNGIDDNGPERSYNGLRMACIGTSCVGRVGEYLRYPNVIYGTLFRPTTTAIDDMTKKYFGVRLVATPSCR